VNETTERTPVAVVTGGSRGIGRAIAEQLAQDGYAVVVLDRDEPGARATAAEIGAHAVAADVTEPAAVRAALGRLDRIDVLVNNAGAWRFQTLREVTPEDYRAVMDTNVLGTLACTQVAAELMAENGDGAIVNITSLAAASGSTGMGMYAASKAAMITITRQAAMEYAPDGIRVNAVAPGIVPTEGTASYYGGPEELARRTASFPLARAGTPTEIAHAVSFLVSERAAYINGQTLFVDGGAEAGLSHFMGRAMAATMRAPAPGDAGAAR
jgi:3-oxoacyl-[acyl-carrier protein] reductase